MKFSEIENTVFFPARKWMEIWYLLITENFLFWTFQRWKIRSFFEPKLWWKGYIYWLLKSSCFELFGNRKYGLFLSQEVNRKMIFTDYWKFIVLNSLGMGNMVFFWAKKLMERWYLVWLSELSRTWEIWLFVQWM